MCADEKQPDVLPEFTRWLAGSERPRPASHRHLGALHPEEAVAFTLLMRRKPGSPPLPDAENPQRGQFGNRPYLSTEEYIEIYGANPAELEAAAAFFERQGMTALEAHAGRRTLSILGTAVQVNAVFGVNLQRYMDPRATELLPPVPNDEEPEASPRSHRGFDGAVYLPAELAEIVVAVVGLDDRFLGSPRGTAAGESAHASYPPVSAALQKLKLPNTGAYSEVIGIMAAQAPGFPGTPPCYLPSDIHHLYFANLPSGYRTRPASILDINLTVGVTTYRNNSFHVTSISSLDGANNAVLELTQDISTSAAVAQGARMNVYFTEASEQGYVQFLTRVLLPNREKRPTVLSVSLGVYEASDAKGRPAQARTGASGSPAFGVSVFIAVGDSSTGKWRLLAAPNLFPPTAAPRLTADAQGLAATSSTVTSAVLSAASSQIAAGAVGVNDAAAIPHSGHAIPDLCSDVAYSGFFVNGIPYSYTGASCAASFYAGMTAMLRSAFGTGLGFLSSMLFELRKAGLKKNPDGDKNSDGISGNATDAGSDEKGVEPEAPFFVMERTNPRHKFWRWGFRPAPRSMAS
jgi:kumamolisin